MARNASPASVLHFAAHTLFLYINSQCSTISYVFLYLEEQNFLSNTKVSWERVSEILYFFPWPGSIARISSYASMKI